MTKDVRQAFDGLMPDLFKLSVIDTSTLTALKHIFSPDEFTQWCEGLARLVDKQSGYSTILDFARASLMLARRFGPTASLALIPVLEFVHDHVGNRAALALMGAVRHPCAHLTKMQEYSSWLSTMHDVAQHASESFEMLCSRLGLILAQLDAKAFHVWANVGMRITDENLEKRQHYFALRDEAALRAFEQTSSDVLFVDIQPRVVGLVKALFDYQPAMRTTPAQSAQTASRRASFDGALVWMPEAFAGRFGHDAVTHYKAVLTHIAAHACFGPGVRLQRGALKPIQLALVSMIEDARVENLAINEYPGLRRLWLRYHTAQPGTALTAELLMPRLARALIDPDYQDDNPWVIKGREMFFDARSFWDDPKLSREIGGLLGNDLGQMRIQFNAKTYIIEPSYRDDHAGLWEADEPPPQESELAETILNAARIEQQETEQPNSKHEQAEQGSNANNAAKLVEVDEETGIPIARHAEWDYIQVAERREWTVVNAYQPKPAPVFAARDLTQDYANANQRVQRLVKAAKISRPEWLRRQTQGERLDLDACIQTKTDMSLGQTPDPRHYQSQIHKNRDLAVFVLLDCSESTRDRIPNTTRTVLSVARSATALLAEAMESLGDPFALCGFCSDSREDVRLYRVKEFSQSYDLSAQQRLAGVRGRLSTRMGAALRQAGAELMPQRTLRKLVLVITDGEPSDVDVDDPKYLVEDARRAVHQLANSGINVHCVGLQGNGGEAALRRIFGRKGFIVIDKVGALVEKLPQIYMRLTT